MAAGRTALHPKYATDVLQDLNTQRVQGSGKEPTYTSRKYS